MLGWSRKIPPDAMGRANCTPTTSHASPSSRLHHSVSRARQGYPLSTYVSSSEEDG